ncbi:RAD51-associated protein 1-like isoform X2 [Liolophura sinensis]|uniref:RAD51-associated protein 1-like isoform X2 n=1 Tax=Liolophura sinensis TaxID=3198878 RepID=UPI00315814B5
MSESRRPCRSRKTVDYSAFEGEDNDDDFADPTPPTKKAKGSNKENKMNRKKEGELPKIKSQDRGCGNRQSLDEKLFDRDLEAALKLSILSSADADLTEVAVETHSSDKPALSSTTPSVESRGSGVTESKHSLPSVAKLDDEIIALPDDLSENPRKRRKAAVKPVRYDDADDDDDAVEEEWNPAKADKLNSGNDDDDDEEFDPEDSDSDYGSSKKKRGNKKTKSKPVTKKVTPTKTKLKSNVTVTPVHQKKPSVKQTNPKSTTKSSPVTPSHHTPSRVLSGGLKKAWVPPARSTSSSPLASLTVKSPSSGLRLGLSRNQKVKSLHPSVVS